MLLNNLGCYDFQSRARIAESVIFQQAFTGFCDFQSKTKKYKFFRCLAGFYMFFLFSNSKQHETQSKLLLHKNQMSKCFSIIFGSIQIYINKITESFNFQKVFKGLLCFPIHNKNRRIISFLASFYRLFRFPIQSKIRRICSFQAGFYVFQTTTKNAESLVF